MKKIIGHVHSVHTGSNNNLGTIEEAYIDIELEGIINDPHRGYTRETWVGDKQKEGTTRRNERQWSAVSIEEIEIIETSMNLKNAINASSLGANLCFSGISNLSALPKGSILKFPSGVELIVEEYNPPCLAMGKKIAAEHKDNNNQSIDNTLFSKMAKLNRGIVGVIETTGRINQGDEVTVITYEEPSWKKRIIDS
jgi:MOSC domain-containing protein YiiM